MRLSENWNPEPDLIVLIDEHSDRIKTTRVEGPADLVIEILSKSTREIDVEKKLPKYLESGVQETWIIDPETRTVSVHVPGTTVLHDDLASSEAIASSILPGLHLKVKWLWNREQHPANHVIKSMRGPERS